MPINPVNSDHHGHGNHVIIVWCPSVVAERFVHFDRNPTTDGWVIRDYITGWQLSSSGGSPLTIAQIEADSQRDEFPPYRPHTSPDWVAYLTMLSLAVSKRDHLPFSAAAPNPTSGTWEPL